MTEVFGHGHEQVHISIHTPLAGSDVQFGLKFDFNTISIHTPLAGSDGYRLAEERGA